MRTDAGHCIHENAQKVVNLLLDSEHVRVCSACEREFGPVQISPGQIKTHGLCKRHALELFGSHLPPEKLKALEQKPEENFAPDLAQLQAH
jgi:hypothetical protein